MNYLIPIGANIGLEAEIPYESVDANRVLALMENAGNRLNMMFLDACRDNPFARSFRTSNQGLAQMDAPRGSLVAFATAPGKTAADGDGRNGLFTGHLLKQMQHPDLELDQIMKNVTRDVARESANQQIPWRLASTTGDFFFHTVTGAPGTTPGTQVAGGAFEQQRPGQGELSIRSEPSGADISIDDVYYGTSPLTVTLTPGVHRVKAAKSGYRPETQATMVRLGVSLDLTLVLDKAGGTATIRSTPPGSAVHLGDVYYGTTPTTIDGLADGTYRLTLKQTDYQDWEETITIRGGNTVSVTATLKPSGPPPTITDPTTGMELVWVEGGCFQMGDTFGEGMGWEKPVHEVCLDGYYLGRYEVTQGQWEKVMGRNPSSFKKGDSYPVESVSWDDIQDFLKALNGRSSRRYGLPTEAQWEYAARERGRQVRFGHGQDTIDPTQANFNGSEQYKQPYSRTGVYRESTTPVGQFPPNALGLYDMAGNVWEWCEDVFDAKAYTQHARNNPVSTSGSSYRVLRGGSWGVTPRYCRSAYRSRIDPSYRNRRNGFRLVLLSGQPR
jgi:formylglycine-generating enzyme required for sulfatase activity